ncbi:general secretion pathway protein D [Desulfobaculum xiamenense]|uniref:General secretion pathway protein D n=1 Tax=Desulfobaculum xiamenense TaxID=995050 RepID=A0A846QN91_9BACT|nr:type II secretion system secretin GspD [Desulfobaculum xiamenense]NJB68657.1 general secretion pathway protein D [Desulfobaculum xiamenense]
MRHAFGTAFLSCLLLTLLSGAALCQEGKNVQANLDNILIGDLVKFVANYTGKNFVYDERIPEQRVSIYSKEPVSEAELMTILRHMLLLSGYDVVVKDDVHYVVRRGQVKEIGDTLYPQLGPGGDDERITVFYRLEGGLDPKTAADLVKTMVSPDYGAALPVPQARALLISDKRLMVQRMVEVLDSVPITRPNWVLELISLEKVKAMDAQRLLAKFYGDLEAKGFSGEPPLSYVLGWSNTVLVAGLPAQVTEVKKLLHRIDTGEEVTSNYKIYRLKNSKASAVAEVLSALGAKLEESSLNSSGESLGAEGDGAKGTSSRSSHKKEREEESFLVSADVDTNTLVALGDPDFLARVDAIVAELDRPLDQVFVEALILETSLENARSFGVEWLAGGGGSNIGGSIGFVDKDGSLLNFQAPTLKEDPESPAFSELPGGFTLGVLGDVVTYDGVRYPSLGALITYLKSATGVNILSTPQILTVDNSEAEIFVGEERFVTEGKTVTDGGNFQTQYREKEIGVKLRVTPHINAEDGLIHMDVYQEVSNVVQSLTKEVSLPVTTKRNTKTSVQLLNGATMVIGGLIQDDLNRRQKGVPGVSDVPLLGWLFKTRGTSATKRTLMLFVSARIVHTKDDAERLSRRKIDEARRQTREVQDAINQEFDLDEDEIPPNPVDESIRTFGTEGELPKPPADAGALAPAARGEVDETPIQEGN